MALFFLGELERGANAIGTGMMSEKRLLRIEWHDAGREPQCPADPAYPDGMHVDLALGSDRFCATTIPYPAPRCGYWLIECSDCGQRIALTAAGRADDPRSVKMACHAFRQHGTMH